MRGGAVKQDRNVANRPDGLRYERAAGRCAPAGQPSRAASPRIEVENLLDRPAAAAAGSGPADPGGATVTSDGPALTIEGDHLVARPGPGTVTTFTVTVPMG